MPDCYLYVISMGIDKRALWVCQWLWILARTIAKCCLLPTYLADCLPTHKFLHTTRLNATPPPPPVRQSQVCVIDLPTYEK
jgi:hypothetical protein